MSVPSLHRESTDSLMLQPGAPLFSFQCVEMQFLYHVIGDDLCSMLSLQWLKWTTNL